MATAALGAASGREQRSERDARDAADCRALLAKPNASARRRSQRPHLGQLPAGDWVVRPLHTVVAPLQAEARQDALVEPRRANGAAPQRDEQCADRGVRRGRGARHPGAALLLPTEPLLPAHGTLQLGWPEDPNQRHAPGTGTAGGLGRQENLSRRSDHLAAASSGVKTVWMAGAVQCDSDAVMRPRSQVVTGFRQPDGSGARNFRDGAISLSLPVAPYRTAARRARRPCSEVGCPAQPRTARARVVLCRT